MKVIERWLGKLSTKLHDDKIILNIITAKTISLDDINNFVNNFTEVLYNE